MRNERRAALIALLLGAAATAAAAQQARVPESGAYAVTLRVDASKPLGELRPIWRFFGADEPTYAYMKDGRKLLQALGEASPEKSKPKRWKAYFVRAVKYSYELSVLRVAANAKNTA